MVCGRRCVTELRTKPAPRLDIFIEILLRGSVNKAKKKGRGCSHSQSPGPLLVADLLPPTYYYGPFSAARHESPAQPLSACSLLCKWVVEEDVGVLRIS
jgi:hypothetical protein